MKCFSLLVAGLLASGLMLCPYAARGETAVADIFYNQALKNDPVDLEKAAQLYASAIAEFDKTGTRDDRYATCLSNLALIELKGNDLTGAEGHIKRSLDASENHQLMAKNYQMMGDIKAKQDKLTEADGAYNGTLEIYSKYGDSNHQEAAVLEKLASIYDRMGKAVQANALRVKATDLATFQVTDRGAQTAYKLGTRALIANDYPGAIKQFELALQLQADFKAAKMNLAIAYQHEALEHQHKSEYAAAEANYLLSLPAMESAFGAKHAYTCTVLQGLCETLESENKFEDAEKYASRWVDIERETTKSGQPVVNALRSYSRILKANKKTDQATAIDKELAGDQEKDKKKIDFSSFLEQAKLQLSLGQ
jgi:tetratricopeptide (TPR) repeat protein